MMLEFKQSDTAASMILTLSELVTLTAPNFLFVFTHALTKGILAFVKASADDESDYPDRYNQFAIDPSVLFAGTQPGEWHYVIYEQASSSNVDPALAGTPLEHGKLMLDRPADFEFEKYNSPTTYKAYNG